MLESATVTLSYNEFQALKEKADKAKHYEKEMLQLEKIIEDKIERKALDDIYDALVNATNSAETIKSKQAYIDKCIKIYCNTFNIPISVVMNNFKE